MREEGGSVKSCPRTGGAHRTAHRVPLFVVVSKQGPRFISINERVPRIGGAYRTAHRGLRIGTVLGLASEQGARSKSIENRGPRIGACARALRPCESPSHPRAHSGEGAHRVRHSSCLRAMRLSCRTLVCAATVDLFLSVKVCGTATAEGALSKSIIVSRA